MTPNGGSDPQMFGIGTKRDSIAIILVLFAVPLSVFGRTNIACVGQGLSQDCRTFACSSRRCC